MTMMTDDNFSYADGDAGVRAHDAQVQAARAEPVPAGVLSDANNILIRFRAQQGQYADQAIMVGARKNYSLIEHYDEAREEHLDYISVPVGYCGSGHFIYPGKYPLEMQRPDYAKAHPQVAAAVAEITRRIGRDVPVQINLPADKLSPDTPAEWSRTVLKRFG